MKEWEELRNIDSTKELIEIFVRELHILGKENRFEKAAEQSEDVIKKNFDKTTERFQEGSESRQLLRQAVKDLGQTSWKDQVKNLVTTFKTKIQKDTQEKNQKHSQEKIDAHIDKLGIRLFKIHRRIKKLESKDVHCDDDEEWNEDSVYSQLDSYKKMAVKIYKKIQSLRNESEKVGRARESHINVEECPSYPRLSGKIQKYVNKVDDLPDIDDFKDLINRYKNSGTSVIQSKLNAKAIGVLAEKFLKEVGQKWSKRRLKDLYEDLLYLGENEEGQSSDLIRDLSENRKHCRYTNKPIKSEADIFNSFTIKQEAIDSGAIPIEKLSESEESEESENEDVENSQDKVMLGDDDEFEIDCIESEYEEEEPSTSEPSPTNPGSGQPHGDEPSIMKESSTLEDLELEKPVTSPARPTSPIVVKSEKRKVQTTLVEYISKKKKIIASQEIPILILDSD